MTDYESIRIRPDIKRILAQPEDEFERWYTERRDATERLIADYTLFASIPNLAYPTLEYTMAAMTHVNDHLKYLREGLEYLTEIAKTKGYYSKKE